jgi:hypothetical protein
MSKYIRKDPKDFKRLGRPPIDLVETFRKLQPFLQLGYSIYKSALMGEVPYTSLWEYCQSDEDFRKKLERERTLPNVVARRNIVSAINSGDVKTSIDWLERNEGDEFAKVQKIEDITPVEEGVILLREIVATRRKIKKLPSPEGEIVNDNDPIRNQGEK